LAFNFQDETGCSILRPIDIPLDGNIVTFVRDLFHSKPLHRRVDHWVDLEHIVRSRTDSYDSADNQVDLKEKEKERDDERDEERARRGEEVPIAPVLTNPEWK